MSRNRPRDNRTTSKVIYATLAIVGILVYYKSSSNLDAPAAPLSKPVTVQRRSPSQLQQQQIPLNAQPSADGTLKQRIVAIGDIHGDYSALTQILRTVSLIDMRGNWCGDNTVLVQTGDLVDRGPALIAITKFWDSLRPQAEKAGGQVVNLLGNHELVSRALRCNDQSHHPLHLSLPYTDERLGRLALRHQRRHRLVWRRTTKANRIVHRLDWSDMANQLFNHGQSALLTQLPLTDCTPTTVALHAGWILVPRVCRGLYSGDQLLDTFLPHGRLVCPWRHHARVPVVSETRLRTGLYLTY